MKVTSNGGLMPIQATVILDSGCFLPNPGSSGVEIGYFASSKEVSDIRILADGVENTNAAPINLGKNSIIEVRHVKANGEIKKTGLMESPMFHRELLQLKELYGRDMPVDRRKFDCVIRFDSGYFSGSLVKPRYFEEHKKQANGRFVHTAEDKRKLIRKPIAHNVLVHFKLNKGESLELVRDGEVFWSSRDSGAKELLEIEIIADNMTAEKFYRQALQDKRDSYWLPNIGDPPPMQPEGGPIFGSGWRSERELSLTVESPVKEPPAKTVPPQKYITVPVFYGTTCQRTKSRSLNKSYGHKRGDFEYGMCEVSIPEIHKMGEVERPSLWRFEFTENPDKHVVLLSINQMQEPDFFSALSLAINNSGEKSAFVFVHGFNVSFAEAARRTAQLAVDLQFDGAPIFYSWPSKGKLSRPAYRHDANNIQLSALHLEKFLMNIASKSKAKTLHLIAHSMGNRALTEALDNVATRMMEREPPAFNEVVLTAPDIDAELFKQIAKNFQKAANRVTLYASSNDEALAFSKKYQGNYPRAGHTGDGIVIVEGIDSIDASEVDTSFIGHFYYGDNDSVLSDLFYLLKDSKPPGKRFGLIPKVCSEGKYWAFKPKKK
jgi:esterase/lipase superfamily enzyme